VHTPTVDEMVNGVYSPAQEPAGRFASALPRRVMGVDVQAISTSPFQQAAHHHAGAKL
jgi:hypothetical protein